MNSAILATYSLKILNEPFSKWAGAYISQLKHDFPACERLFNDEGAHASPCLWMDYNSTLVRFSHAHPNVIFQLLIHCQDDLRAYFYKAGLTYDSPGTMTVENFNPDLLR